MLVAMRAAFGKAVFMPVSVAVTMAAQNDEAGEVRTEAKAADDKNETRLFDLWWINEPRDGFEDD